MKRTFQRRLLIVIVIAFAVTFLALFIVQTIQARTSAEGLIAQRVEDVELSIDENAAASALVRASVDQGALARTRALAELIAANPSILTDQPALDELTTKLEVDEIYICNSEGIIIAASPTSFIGYDMKDAEQSAAFMGAIEYPDFKLAQEPMERGVDGSSFQYVGVSRLDEPGIVQIGYLTATWQQAFALTNFSHVAENLHIGSGGEVFVLGEDTVVSACNASLVGASAESLGLDVAPLHADGTPFFATVNGKKSMVVATSYTDYIIVGTMPKKELYESRTSSALGLILFNALLFLIVFFQVSNSVQRVVISGIYKINDSLGKITHGKLDERVEVTTSPEFELLSGGINSTVSALKEAIAKEASRIDDELELARTIQANSLQHEFPPFPNHPEFDVFATMSPAREVGGDFYDIFLTAENYPAVIIADVSGKGIPAAMFMMKAKSLLKGEVPQFQALNSLFENVNDELCESNELNMFVTAFMAVLDTDEGLLTFVNAGHNPPVILHPDGELEEVRAKPGFVLGGMPGIIYQQDTIEVREGDILYLYTDGVTEALNEEGVFFEMDKLLDTLKDKHQLSSKDLLAEVEGELRTFIGNAEQADDITMMALRFVHPTRPHPVSLTSHTTVLDVPAQVEQLDTVLSFLNEQLATRACPARTVNQLSIATEEVFVNIAHYAYADTEPSCQCEPHVNMARITVDFDDEQKTVTIILDDTGTAYDPLAREDPDITLPAAERDAGGLGIYMTKMIADHIQYVREDGHNILSITKSFAPKTEGGQA